jgi:hypothetical protein
VFSLMPAHGLLLLKEVPVPHRADDVLVLNCHGQIIHLLSLIFPTSSRVLHSGVAVGCEPDGLKIRENYLMIVEEIFENY